MGRRMTLKGQISLCLAAFFLALAGQIFLSFYQSGTVLRELDDQMGNFNAISRFQNGVERSLSAMEDYRWEYGDAKALTEELFRYSIAASSQPLVPVPLDLRGALEEALLSFYGAMEQRNITPEIQLPESRVERCLDPSALSRIFSNILGNALNTAVETSLSAWTRREPLSLPTPQQVSPPSPPGDSLIASTPSKPAAAPLAWVCPL